MFDFRDVLDVGGLVARRRPDYERRDAQLEMAAEVDAAIRGRRNLAIEAGTGVGKSFAYLVPAILYAVEDQVRDYRPDAPFPFGEPSSESANKPTSAPPSESANKPTSAPPSAPSSESANKPTSAPPSESANESPSDASASDRLAPTADPDELCFNDPNAPSPTALRRVVVSTHTIGLQEQLFEKDVPFLQSILPFEFTAALAKGRSNYLCRRRFAAAAKGAAAGTLFETDRQAEFERLKRWLESTADGSLSDLDPTPPAEVWNEICCERGNCLGRKCKFNDRCFYAKARRRLENARILIVNHALLFSDLAVRAGGGSILPTYDALIFDEAHTMEEVAAEHLGSETTQGQIDYLLDRLYNDRTIRGALIDANVWSQEVDADPSAFERARKLSIECRYRAEEFFNDLTEWLEARPGSSGRVFEPRIVKNGLSEALVRLRNALRDAADAIGDESRRQEIVAARFRVESLLAAIDDWIEQRSSGFVYWLERLPSRWRLKVSMRSAPIDVAGVLRSRLFSVVPSTIAASATLTTRATPGSVGSGESGGRGKIGERRETGKIGERRETGDLRNVGERRETGDLRNVGERRDVGFSTVERPPIVLPESTDDEETRRAFAFFRTRVGLTDARARALGSPFDYRRQMTLVLTKGLELDDDAAARAGWPASERLARNERRLDQAIRDYIDETDGGAFVLFTNRERLKRAAASSLPWLVERGYSFFSQADGTPRRRMVAGFKASRRGVLFGLDSFWQGVDVPGDALRNVIVVKFPFLAPGQPLVEARSEAVKARGGSGFRDYVLPTAILKFKQGVGRLIRTKTDVGRVVVLDSRVHTKTYGREFLRALPDCKVRVDVFR